MTAFAPPRPSALPLIGSLAALLAPMRAQEATTDRARLDRATIERVLAQLDEAFERGEPDAFLRTFEADHPALHDQVERRTRQLLAKGPLQCTTSVLGELRTIGEHSVALVRREVRRSERSQPLATHLFVAFKRDGDTARPTLAVELPGVPNEHIVGEQFACPPCNYRVGGAPGWLCVPHCMQQAASMETVSFYLLGADVAVDVSIQIDEDEPKAAAVAQKYAKELAGATEGASLEPVEPWQPPSLAKAPPRFDAARAAVRLPDDRACVFHVAVLGGVQHLLLLRGSKRALERHRARVDELLATYELTEPDADLALAASRALSHHSGELVGDRFVHARRGISVKGPKGFTPKVRAGGFAFQVKWTSPDGAWLCCTGYPPPAGMTRWGRAEVERWLEQLGRSENVTKVYGVVTTEPQGPWREDDGRGFAERSFAAEATASDGKKEKRLLRLCLRDDLAVVFFARADSEAHVRAVLDAVATLRKE